MLKRILYLANRFLWKKRYKRYRKEKNKEEERLKVIEEMKKELERREKLYNSNIKLPKKGDGDGKRGSKL